MRFADDTVLLSSDKNELISGEIVNAFVYLGQITSFDSIENKQIEARISSAHKKIFKSQLPLYDKKRLFDACVQLNFTYSQPWSLTENMKVKLAVAQRSMERSMMNIQKNDKA
jgi:hypothetical protein